MALRVAPSPCMDGEMGSLTLGSLAEQFQYYKHSSLNEKKENRRSSDNTDTNLGIAESLAIRGDQFSCVNNGKKKRAAVLICLFEGQEGELRVILTKRSMKMFTYPGHVALPGGKMEDEDADDSATALREAKEEVGLDPTLVHVVGNLEPFVSQHLLAVVPVIGLLARTEDFKPVLNTDEVDVIFDVPLEMFLKEDNHRYEEGREWMGQKYVVHLFDFESEKGVFVIWGLTASILIRAASIVYQRIPSFSHHLPDFQQLQFASNIVVP